jgi:hypothetical protein
MSTQLRTAIGAMMIQFLAVDQQTRSAWQWLNVRWLDYAKQVLLVRHRYNGIYCILNCYVQKVGQNSKSLQNAGLNKKTSPVTRFDPAISRSIQLGLIPECYRSSWRLCHKSRPMFVAPAAGLLFSGLLANDEQELYRVLRCEKGLRC